VCGLEGATGKRGQASRPTDRPKSGLLFEIQDLGEKLRRGEGGSQYGVMNKVEIAVGIVLRRSRAAKTTGWRKLYSFFLKG